MEKQQLYTIKLEATAPIELVYKVWAKDPEDALEQMNRWVLAQQPRPKLSRMKRIQAKVYRYGMSIIEATKRFV